MKHLIALSILFMMFTMTSCELIGDIFSAGFYTGLFLVVVVIVVIIFIVVKMRGRR
jgi:TRAP-type C4-dicarboxylate transport system permease large subunit